MNRDAVISHHRVTVPGAPRFALHLTNFPLTVLIVSEIRTMVIRSCQRLLEI